MTLLAPASRRLRAAASWLALAALGQGLLGGLAHRHDHEASHEEAVHGIVVTATGETEGCAARHVHSVAETHEDGCSACALLHGKTFRERPLVVATTCVAPAAVSAPAPPASDRRALAPLPARGPPSA